MELHTDFLVILLGFAFYYPLFMSWTWIIGGTLYYLKRERTIPPGHLPSLPDHSNGWPAASLIVPCHNEGSNVRDTIAWLNAQDYPDFEIIAVNDGSTDNTGEILDALLGQYPRLRVIHLASNEGKAVALRTGSLAAHNEYLVCVDGDALLDPAATAWLIYHMVTGVRVGAVTGNPRIRNRSSLLGKLQVGEFSSIIGLIKRAQRIYGRIFTVSGVIAAYRKRALQDAGYWATDMITDDIDISWKLQMRHWDIRFEPAALCWILMPETFKGLWRQRLRWAVGGMQAFLRYTPRIFSWRQRRFWGIWLEFLVSVLWACAMGTVAMLFLAGLVFDLPTALQVNTLLAQWHGLMLAFLCMVQFAVSMYIDSRYEQGLGRKFYWMIWYPMAFWLIALCTTLASIPATVTRRRGKAVWTSPDRGIQELAEKSP